MLSFITSVLCMSVQAAGLAGTQAQLCTVCHGEGRQQGHVHQKRCGQRAQQKSVGGATADLAMRALLGLLAFRRNTAGCEMFTWWNSAPCVPQGGERDRGGRHRSGRFSQPTGPDAEKCQ